MYLVVLIRVMVGYDFYDVVKVLVDQNDLDQNVNLVYKV